ncbi:MAG: hypothetical protein F4X66_18955 [Chloroflexi bacterium]|nr:hypothetical protein [Chloroflexota bacterium]MYE40564.1 hypothetical protein [Chloroflexota bacterium]
MTTINDISDLVRVLEERPDWRAAIRNLLLGEDLLNVPQQLAQFIETTNQFIESANENFRVVNARLNRLEGKMGNFEGNDYEHRIANHAMLRARRHFGLNNPVIAMSNYLPHSPDFDRVLTRAVQSGEISDDDMYDLYEADIIVSDDDNRFVVFDVSLTADSDDIARAVRRADVMAAISDAESMPAVATENIHELQQDLADRMNVAVFIIPNR